MRRSINLEDRWQKNSWLPGTSAVTSRNTGGVSLGERGVFTLDQDNLGKLAMASVIDRFLIWWLRSGRYRWSRLRRRLCEHKYLAVSLPEVGSLDEIKACLSQVKWTMDGPLHLFDCISYPQVTWAKKKDDCDGFASLAAELLHQWNPNCNPVLITTMLRPFRASHTVCAFTISQGNLCFFDNDSLRCESYHTYDEIVAIISKRGQRLVCWDVRNPATLEMLEFHKL